jgi:hypothetical protein
MRVKNKNKLVGIISSIIFSLFSILMDQCDATAKSTGQRCKNHAMNGSHFCRTHDETKSSKYKEEVDFFEDEELNMALEQIRRDGHALKLIPKRFKNDKEVVLTAINNYIDDYIEITPFYYASDELKNDKEVVLAAFERDNGSFDYATDSLKDDNNFLYELWESTNFRPIDANDPIYLNASDETMEGLDDDPGYLENFGSVIKPVKR